MKLTTRAPGIAGLTLLLLVAIASVALAAKTLPLMSSSQIPAAEGTARIQNTQNGNTQIRLTFKHLAPPDRIVPGSTVFVLWIRGQAAGAVAQNLGALKVDKNLNAKLTTITALTAFDLFLTCEQSQTATEPATLELLPLHYMPQ